MFDLTEFRRGGRSVGNVSGIIVCAINLTVFHAAVKISVYVNLDTQLTWKEALQLDKRLKGDLFEVKIGVFLVGNDIEQEGFEFTELMLMLRKACLGILS